MPGPRGATGANGSGGGVSSVVPFNLYDINESLLLSVTKTGTGTTRIETPQDDLSLRSARDITLYAGSDGPGKVYIGWGDAVYTPNSPNEVATHGYVSDALSSINLVKAGLWNYPSNNGVVLQTTQHNESIAIKSNQSAALRWHIRDDGSFVGSDSLVILSHNQSLSDGSAVGFDITEREIPPVTGHYYYVNINTGDSQFNGQYLCVASTTTTITFDYVNDVSAYDTTGITGNIGLPSIYNQVEARENGVWIKNANWSDPSNYAHYWNFKTDGSIQFPTLYSNARTGLGEVIQFGNDSQQSIITGPPATSGNPTANRLVIAGQDAYPDTAAEGGDIYLWAGRGQNGGDIKLDGGNSLSDGQGGTVKMRGGYSPNGVGGFVEIRGGDSYTQAGGDITIAAGSSYNGEGTPGGNLNLSAGYSSSSWAGGNISLTTTASGTISLNSSGDIIAGNILRPSTDNTMSLGTSAYRWSSLYLGPGTLNITDSVLNTNAGISVANGVFNINGIAQAQLPALITNNLELHDGSDNIVLRLVEDTGIGKLFFGGGTNGIWQDGGKTYITGVGYHAEDSSIKPMYYNSATGEVTYDSDVIADTLEYVSAVPAHDHGAPGDEKNNFAYDATHLYICIADYVNDSTTIWKRINWSSGNW